MGYNNCGMSISWLCDEAFLFYCAGGINSKATADNSTVPFCMSEALPWNQSKADYSTLVLWMSAELQWNESKAA